MKPKSLSAIFRPLLAALPLSAMGGCCPPDSNQQGPQWTVTVPAALVLGMQAGAADGGLPDGGTADGGLRDGGAVDGMMSSPQLPSELCQCFCEPEKNCPQCAGQGYRLDYCQPPRRQADGAFTFYCTTLRNQCIGGRRPAGLEAAGDDGSAAGVPEAGGYFAELSRLEAASVAAFTTLRRQLSSLRAPRRLLRAAGRAARDEVRHARLCGALATRHGAGPLSPRITPLPPRTLEEMAIDNEVEGCVRETYGALLAHHQARVARDPAVRAAMTVIGRDETEHAALSFAVARFLRSRLSRAARDRVMVAAVASLQAEARRPPPRALREAAGLPDAAAAADLLQGLSQALWAA